MSQLRSLKNVTRDYDLNIIEEVQSDWVELADLLDLSHCVKNLRSLDNKDACRRVFELWLDGEGDDNMPRNWQTIIYVLRNMKRKKLAEQVHETLFAMDL